MGIIKKAGFLRPPHAHLMGRPGLIGQENQVPSKVLPRVQMAPYDGSKLWAELHKRALNWTGESDADWLSLFRQRVPCGECRRHWDSMLIKTPPDWPNYWLWTIERHNEVNLRLFKREFTPEEAHLKWSEPPQ